MGGGGSGATENTHHFMLKDPKFMISRELRLAESVPH